MLSNASNHNPFIPSTDSRWHHCLLRNLLRTNSCRFTFANKKIESIIPYDEEKSYFTDLTCFDQRFKEPCKELNAVVQFEGPLILAKVVAQFAPKRLKFCQICFQFGQLLAGKLK